MSFLTRLKSVAQVVAGQSPQSDEVHELTDGLPFIQGNAEFGTRFPTPVWECNQAPKLAYPGDLLLSVRAPVGALNMATERIGIGRGVAAVRANDLRNQRWLYWALEASREDLISRATGSTFGAVRSSDIGELRLLMADEPDRVADYLDHETAEIDAFISEQRVLRSFLEERWVSSLVSEIQGRQQSGRTETLVPTWPLAPRTWRRARLKSTVRFSTNGAWGEDAADGTGVRCIRVADFDKLRGIVHNHNPTSRAYDRNVVGRLGLRFGDLILEKSGGGPTSPVGNVVRYTGGGGDMYSNFVARIEVARDVDSEYALRLHQAMYVSGVTGRSVKQTTGIQNLDEAAYLDEPVFLPDREVQEQIAATLLRERQTLDDAIADIDAAIALAKERRAALITAAVTGQIDVTGFDTRAARATQPPTIEEAR